jgi:hypothetical protein
MDDLAQSVGGAAADHIACEVASEPVAAAGVTLPVSRQLT